MPIADIRLEELLTRLEQLWREQGAPIADHLAPGLGEDGLDRRQAESGLRFPTEIRTWWGWHDGIRRLQPGTRLGRESLVGVGPWEMLSCAESLKYAAMMRGVAADMWEPTWLPVLAYDAHQVFVDCGQDRDGRVPVRVWDAETDDRERHRLGSFTDLVALSVRLLESGYSTWSAEYRMWVRRRDLVPGDAWRTGLI